MSKKLAMLQVALAMLNFGKGGSMKCRHSFKALPYRAKLCRAKVTNFLKGDKTFARRKISPIRIFYTRVSSVLNGPIIGTFERGIVKMTCLSM